MFCELSTKAGCDYPQNFPAGKRLSKESILGDPGTILAATGQKLGLEAAAWAVRLMPMISCLKIKAVWNGPAGLRLAALLLGGSVAMAPAQPIQSADAVAAQAWAQVPEILKRIVPPVFPDRDFAITNYGAVGDGGTDCTPAFAKAIAACAQAGGGRVIVPAGKFLTGAIHLLSNVNLHIVKDGTILFSTDPQKYLPVVFTRYECTELMNYSPLIYAYEQRNIAITGEGTLDSQATIGPWHHWKNAKADTEKLVAMGNADVPVAQRVFGDGHQLRPYFVQPVRCQNVLIEGVKILGSPMWVLSPLYCTNVTVRGVTVNATGPNTDGCDPDSCTDVWIKDCSFSDGDDCIAIKSGRDHDGRRVNLPSQNIVIQNCTFKAGHGGVTMGSETAGGIRKVFAEDCHFDSPDLEMAMRFKSNPARGGFIEDIYLRRCTIKTAKVGIHMTLRYSSAGAMEGEFVPRLRNIDIRDSVFENLTRQPVFIEGYSATAQITDVTIANCVFQSAKRISTITNAVRVKRVNNRGLD